MTTENFAYWLEGFAELCGEKPTDLQWTIIKDHLALVFNKVTPDRRENKIVLQRESNQPYFPSPLCNNKPPEEPKYCANNFLVNLGGDLNVPSHIYDFALKQSRDLGVKPPTGVFWNIEWWVDRYILALTEDKTPKTPVLGNWTGDFAPIVDCISEGPVCGDALTESASYCAETFRDAGGELKPRDLPTGKLRPFKEDGEDILDFSKYCGVDESPLKFTVNPNAEFTYLPTGPSPPIVSVWPIGSC